MATPQRKPRVHTFPIKLALTFAAIAGTLGGWVGLSATSVQEIQTDTTASTAALSENTLVAQVVPLPTATSTAAEPTETTETTTEVAPTPTTATTDQTTEQSSSSTMARTRSSR